MKLLSSSFEHEKSIPELYSCNGDNINPELHWTEIPSGTKSLCLIVYDPDSPSGLWVHWILFNIAPTTNSIKSNSVPVEANLGFNSWRKFSYSGPCPPSGTHRYYFKLYALDCLLDSKKSYTKNAIESEFKSHILAEALLMGRFRK